MPPRTGKPNKRVRSMAPIELIEGLPLKDLRELHARIGRVIEKRYKQNPNVNDFPSYGVFEQVINDLMPLLEGKISPLTGIVLAKKDIETMSFREILALGGDYIPLPDLRQALKPLFKNDALPDYRCWEELKAYRDDKTKFKPYSKNPKDTDKGQDHS